MLLYMLVILHKFYSAQVVGQRVEVLLDQAFLPESLEVLFLTVDVHCQTHGEEDVDELHGQGNQGPGCKPVSTLPACRHSHPPLSSHHLTYLQHHQSNSYPTEHYATVGDDS